MRYLTEAEVVRAVTLIQEGWTIRAVPAELNVASSVVGRAWKRFIETGTYTRRQGQGPKHKTSARNNRYVVNCALRRRTDTARDHLNNLRAATGVTVSDQTIRNRLPEVGLRPRRPCKVPRLQCHHKVDRLRFAQQHRNWQFRHWRNVLFTDESRFRLTNCDGRLRVYRRRGEFYDEATVQEIDRFGAGSVMVWGGISIDGVTDLVVVRGRLNAARDITNIVLEHVMPVSVQMGPEFVLQQVNARVHTAGAAMATLQNHQTQTMNWPAMGAELNPIVHLWDMLERKVRKRPIAPQTLQELADVLVEEWENIPQRDVRRFIRGMPRRCTAVIRALGGHTNY